MKKSPLLIIPVLLLSFVTEVLGDWEMYYGGIQHLGATSVAPVLNPVVLWTHIISSAVYSSPVVSEGIVYVGALTNQESEPEVQGGGGMLTIIETPSPFYTLLPYSPLPIEPLVREEDLPIVLTGILLVYIVYFLTKKQKRRRKH